MECSKCGSSWESKSFVYKCPFCGAVLNESVKNISFEDTLSMILSQHGVEILKEKEVVSLLKDYVPKETKKIELINIFVTKNVGREFVEMYNDEHNSWENTYEYCIKRLQEDAFLGHDFACLILDDIGNALNIKRSNKSNLSYNNTDAENKTDEDSFRGSGDNQMFCKHSEDKNQSADNLREVIELFTILYTDIYFSLIKKVDTAGNTTYEIIFKDSDGNRYDDNISTETILNGIAMLQHKNEKKVCNPDRKQIREFLFNQPKKYREEAIRKRYASNVDNQIFCKHSEDENQSADNLREVVELFTVHYIEIDFSFETDIYFSLIKKVDTAGNTTYEIISKDLDGNRYDDNISAETTLKGIVMLQHKNEKSLCNPDRMQIREFLLNQRKKYEEKIL